MLLRLMLLLLPLLILSSTGCSSVVQDAIDAADAHVREKWVTEWRDGLKDTLMDELRGLATEGKQEVLDQMVQKLDAYEGRLTALGVDVRSHDVNNDGQMELKEALSLLQDIKEKNDHLPPGQEPLNWWEIVGLVMAAYFPATTLKEAIKSRMAGRSAGRPVV